MTLWRNPAELTQQAARPRRWPKREPRSGSRYRTRRGQIAGESVGDKPLSQLVRDGEVLAMNAVCLAEGGLLPVMLEHLLERPQPAEVLERFVVLFSLVLNDELRRRDV